MPGVPHRLDARLPAHGPIERKGTVGARARERVVGGSAHDPVALSVAGRTVDHGGRFVVGATPPGGANRLRV
jgi:hypothetical protein